MLNKWKFFFSRFHQQVLQFTCELLLCLLADFWVGRYIQDVVVNPPQRDRLVPPIFYAEFQKLSDWMVVVELRIKLVMHATTYIHIQEPRRMNHRSLKSNTIGYFQGACWIQRLLQRIKSIQIYCKCFGGFQSTMYLTAHNVIALIFCKLILDARQPKCVRSSKQDI